MALKRAERKRTEERKIAAENGRVAVETDSDSD